MDSSGLTHLDEISVNRSISGILFFPDFAVKAGFSLSDYGDEDQFISPSAIYTNWQLYSAITRSLIQKRWISSFCGLGGSFSNSSFRYFSGTGLNPLIAGNTNRYFYMSRSNSVGIRGEMNVLFNVYRSRSSKMQVLLGLSSAYVYIPFHVHWANQAGYAISPVPEVKDNIFYFDLAVMVLFNKTASTLKPSR